MKNYHTHTKRCGHAIGEDEEYVLRAIENGFDEIGFSDHAPMLFPDGCGYYSTFRMKPYEAEGYAKSGYRFSSFEENLEITGTKLPITYSDFIVPWCKDISYDDEENAESLFLWDFHFKYAPDRSLSPYTGPRQKRQD